MTDEDVLDEQVSNVIADQHFALPPTHAFVLEDALNKDEEGYIGELKDDGYQSSELGVEEEAVNYEGEDDEECMSDIKGGGYQSSELGVKEETVKCEDDDEKECVGDIKGGGYQSSELGVKEETVKCEDDDEKECVGDIKDDGYQSSEIGAEDETVKADGDDEEKCMGGINDDEYQLSELGVEEIAKDTNNECGRWKIGTFVAICGLALIFVVVGVGARNRYKGTDVYREGGTGETASAVLVPNGNENDTATALPSVCLPKQYFEFVMADAVVEYNCNFYKQCDGNFADTGACDGNTGIICEGACNGPDGACKDNQGDIQGCSCLGSDSCTENEGDVRLFSCNGKLACKRNTGTIGTLSCNGKNRACFLNHGDVGNESCNGLKACWENEAPVKEKSCNGKESCVKNSGAIGAKSCNGEKSCCGNTEVIGSGECNEDFECCNSNESQCDCPPQTNISSEVASLVSLVSTTEQTSGAPEVNTTEINSNSTSLVNNEP